MIQQELSLYEYVADINAKKHVTLVRHIGSWNLYIKKELTDYNVDVYEQLSTLQYEGFPKIHVLGEEEGTLYLIEEYVHGRSLEELIQEEGPLTPARAKRLMLEICASIELLHQQKPPIIHRDIKAANVMLTEDGHVKIVDFNTARKLGVETSQDTHVLGTRGYAPPEQYGYRQTDERSDIYALGVLLHYMLTATYPSERTYHGEAEPIIRKCIQFDPEKRYQTVKALMRDIEKITELFPQKKAESRKREKESVKKKGSVKEKESLKKIGPVKEKKSVKEKRSGFWNNRFLPPGFRTGRIWKMIVSAIYYLFWGYICLTMDLKDTNGAILTGVHSTEMKVGSLVFFYLEALFLCNYLNVFSILPLTKSENTVRKVIGVILYAGLIFLVDLYILIVLQIVR